MANSWSPSEYKIHISVSKFQNMALHLSYLLPPDLLSQVPSPSLWTATPISQFLRPQDLMSFTYPHFLSHLSFKIYLQCNYISPAPKLLLWFKLSPSLSYFVSYPLISFLGSDSLISHKINVQGPAQIMPLFITKSFIPKSYACHSVT